MNGYCHVCGESSYFSSYKFAVRVVSIRLKSHWNVFRELSILKLKKKKKKKQKETCSMLRTRPMGMNWNTGTPVQVPKQWQSLPREVVGYFPFPWGCSTATWHPALGARAEVGPDRPRGSLQISHCIILTAHPCCSGSHSHCALLLVAAWPLWDIFCEQMCPSFCLLQTGNWCSEFSARMLNA